MIYFTTNYINVQNDEGNRTVVCYDTFITITIHHYHDLSFISYMRYKCHASIYHVIRRLYLSRESLHILTKTHKYRYIYIILFDYVEFICAYNLSMR